MLENNIFIVMSSIILQLRNLKFDSVFNFISQLMMIGFVVFLINFLLYAFKKLNMRKNPLKNQQKNVTMTKDIKYDLHSYEKNLYRKKGFLPFKNQTLNKILINYHFLG